ncbi:hypothetical protein BZL54_05980 [Burkholderia ubonensis subsp. mesacidophila]|uniref:Uncharacterized protein n=2 Tax=Burkholderia ubonensis TaxID=101571 RepID=A0A2A4FIQ5_9BURK|nr:hypothetical protein BZL54_05980 [Burkholderia ubonensis subsp. mesacidophila]
MSGKEKCFQAAWDTVKETTGDESMDIDSQQTWGLENGQWISNYDGWWQAIRRFMGAVATQVRRPDLTITQNGTKSVVDLKFNRENGQPDKWGTKIGNSGGTQKEDYGQINKQQNGGKDPYDNTPELSEQSCKCNEETKVEQLVVSPSASFAQDPLLFQGMDPTTAQALQEGFAAAGRGLQGIGELGGRLLGGRGGFLEGEPIVP